MRTANMNVGELKEIIEDYPNSARVVIPGLDHSYYNIRGATLCKAEKYPNGTLSEHYEDIEKDLRTDIVEVVVLD